MVQENIIHYQQETVLKIKIEAHQKDGKVLTINSSKKRRISYFLQRAKKLETTKYIVRVTYGKFEDIFNKKVVFKNEGEYQSPTDLERALKAFLEI